MSARGVVAPKVEPGKSDDLWAHPVSDTAFIGLVSKTVNRNAIQLSNKYIMQSGGNLIAISNNWLPAKHER